MDARAEDLLPVDSFHVVFTLPTEIARIADRLLEQKGGVWPVVQDFRQNGQDHRRRPQKDGREGGPDQRLAQLGLRDDPLFAHPYDRAQRKAYRPAAIGGSSASPGSSCPCGCCRDYSGACSLMG